jgi:excisionase family DNA binding protein
MKTNQQRLSGQALAQANAGARPGGSPPPFPGQDDRDVLLSREETAAYLRVSLPTLELWARNGEGPPARRVGRSVRYRLADLRSFVEGAAA